MAPHSEQDERDSRRSVDSIDAVVTDLAEARVAAGMPSFAEIAVRVGDLRRARGMDARAARPARSTVYDALRRGRRRLDPELIGDIAEALGATDPDAWRRRCALVIHEAGPQADAAGDSTAPESAPPGSTAAPMEHALPGAASSAAVRADVALPVPVAAAGAPATLPRTAVSVRRPAFSPISASRPRTTAVIGAAVGINLLGLAVTHVTGVPLYLDMIGVCLVAMVLGPWPAVVTAVATQAIETIPYPASAPAFALVSIAGALVWGYGARLIRDRSSVTAWIALHAAAGLACSVVAGPILRFLLHGSTGHPSELLPTMLADSWHSELVVLFLRNLTISIPDKIICGAVAAGLVPVVVGFLRSGSQSGVAPAAEAGTGA